MDEHRIPPNILFRSFLLVAGGYVISMILLLTTGMLIIYNFFPDSFAFLSTPDLTKEQLLAEPDLCLPDNVFWSLLFVHALVSFVIGWLVTRFAPIAKFNHAIFLSVVIFIGFLQMAVQSPSELQWKFLLMMAVFPIATLLGAKLLAARDSFSTDESDDDFTSVDQAAD